jgi:ribonuclease HI
MPMERVFQRILDPEVTGTLLICDGQQKELSAGFRRSTNNRMELMGIIAGLKTLEQPCQLQVISDSKYVVDALLQNWMGKWKKKGWMTSAKTPVLNQDLWTELDQLLTLHETRYRWIKGHTGEKTSIPS